MTELLATAATEHQDFARKLVQHGDALVVPEPTVARAESQLRIAGGRLVGLAIPGGA